MKNDIKLRQRLMEYKYDNGLIDRVYCTDEENREFAALLKNGSDLPADVFYDEPLYREKPVIFYRTVGIDLGENEKKEYLQLRKLAVMNEIKNALIFIAAVSAGIFAVAIIALFN